MDDQERRENAERIRRQLAEKRTPLNHIFPTVPVGVRPDAPALVLPDGYATFVAADIPSPHGGTVVRHYLLDCRHGSVEDDYRDARPELDGIVLQRFLLDLWRATGCECRPIGWAAA